MKILSHRGLWKNVHEKNTIGAFIKSFELGFGVETDVRDLNGELVISHDMPDETALRLSQFLDIYVKTSCRAPLALNVKSDGLQKMVKNALADYKVDNYFFFDMSVPDLVGYIKNGLQAFTRQSEWELVPSLYDQAHGVWLDEFEFHWINEEIIFGHLEKGKKVCIVSPELHGRHYKAEWAHYKKIDDKVRSDLLMLCTDYPIAAEEYFNA